MKIAMSADGFVAGPDKKPIHFTTAKQDKEVHKLRAEHQVILVGINTIINDDPELNVRLADGLDPLRVIVDSKLRIPMNSRVLKDKNYLIATCRKTGHKGLNVWVSPSDDKINLKNLFSYLAEIGISSVLVEPGLALYSSLKKQKLIDELIIFRSQKKIKKGLRLVI